MRNLKSLSLFVFIFAHACQTIFIKTRNNSIDSRCVIGLKIYCLQARPCILQPGNLTGWGSAGVNTNKRLEEWACFVWEHLFVVFWYFNVPNNTNTGGACSQSRPLDSSYHQRPYSFFKVQSLLPSTPKMTVSLDHGCTTGLTSMALLMNLYILRLYWA